MVDGDFEGAAGGAARDDSPFGEASGHAAADRFVERAAHELPAVYESARDDDARDAEAADEVRDAYRFMKPQRARMGSSRNLYW